MDKLKFMSVIAGAGLSQRKLAKRVGMSKNTLNNKVNGRGCFDTDEIDRICEVLNISDDREKALIFLTKASQKRDD